MKEYKKILPEVIVGLGDHTQYLEPQPPFRTVLHLHMALEDWLGDDLLECFPCYMVTQRLKEALEKTTFTGFTFADMEVTQSEYFEDNYQLSTPVPKLYWMKITGKEQADDAFIGEKSMLFASHGLIDFFTENFSMKYLDIDPERNEFDDLLEKMLARHKKSGNDEQ